VWYKLDDMSFLTINSYVSMNVPGVAQIISQVLLKFIYFDILYMELWLDKFLALLNIDLNYDDKPMNQYFEQNGLQG
jgi:hypothetical protein